MGKIADEKYQELRNNLRSETLAILSYCETYANAYERYVNAIAWLEEHGDVMEIKNDKGVTIRVQPSPKLEIVKICEKSMSDALKELKRYLIA